MKYTPIVIKLSDIYKQENAKTFLSYQKQISERYAIVDFRPPNVDDLYIDCIGCGLFGGISRCTKDHEIFFGKSTQPRLIVKLIERAGDLNWE